MLSKFSVSNFKGFNKEFVFDLQETKGYSFNKASVKNGIVNNALIYGKNGVGKSNLALAVFDIIGHLTDKRTSEYQYEFYLNAENHKKCATFNFEFIFDDQKVEYSYRKSNNRTIVSEKLVINNEDMAYINRDINDEAMINFKGAENLKKTLSNDSLSILKYVKNNTELENDANNRILLRLFDFVEGMLFFRYLSNKIYLGLENSPGSVIDDIIKRDNVKNLESFLNKAGVECKLIVVQGLEKSTIAFDFLGDDIEFVKIASQGTKALLLFYFWLQRLKDDKNVTFLIIDEFDAFYHHDISNLIIEELKKTEVQFVLTTHNTSNISNDILRPDCYFIMKKDSITPLSKCTSKELREAHNIEKMYKAGSFDVK